MSLSDLVRKALLGGALATASVGAGAVTVSIPAVAEAKPLEELTPATFAKNVYHNPLPVVVLFYQAETSPDNNQPILEAGWRMEKVVEELADKYVGQVAFFKVALDHNPSYQKGDFERKFGVPGISPQVGMYARFDVLTGKKSLHNFRVDVGKGGPVRDDQIQPAIETIDYWIQQNIFGKSPDGDRKLYRHNGTLELHEVGELR